MSEIIRELPVTNIIDDNSTSKHLNTAVLFLVFNRPDTTEKVFESIRIAKPPRLYIAADGPRMDKTGEFEKVDQVRQIVSNIDWPCEVKTLFRDENQGCKLAVSSAITWFFKNESMGIILEDDCLPDPTFFMFCQELLEKYKNDQRIGMISGDNFQLSKSKSNHSYYFSKYTHVWGWATWRDRWLNSYDVNISDWPDMQRKGLLADIIKNKNESSYWSSVFNRVYNGEIDTWDYQWAFANFLQERLNILPEVNLISNIGFGGDATHTSGTSGTSDLANIPRCSINLPLSHPDEVLRNIHADKFTFHKYYMVSLYQRLSVKVISLLRFFIDGK